MVENSLPIVTPAARPEPRQPVNALGVTFIADDFDQTDPETLALFKDDAWTDLS
jgi:hypothetical protein